jgi:hypothetical protein
MGRAGGELNPPASSTEVHSCPLGPLRPLSNEGGLSASICAYLQLKVF